MPRSNVENGSVYGKENLVVRCPRCLKRMSYTVKATSRWDNATEICSDCGIREALEHPTSVHNKVYMGEPYWDRASNNAKILERRWEYKNFIREVSDGRK